MNGDLDGLSAEQLEAILDGDAVPPSPEPNDNPEPAGTAEEAPAATEAPEPEPSDLELERLRREALEAERDHWQRIAGRNGGEIGHLRKRLKEAGLDVAGAESETPESSADLSAYDPDPEPEPSYQEREPERRAEPRASNTDFETYVLNDALAREAAAFTAQHPMMKDKAFARAVAENMLSSGFSVDELAAASSPVKATRQLRDALESAYYSIERPRLETRRAEQFRNQHKAKLTAQISGSGGATPPPSKPRTLDDMSADELDAELRRLTGERPKTRW